MAKKSKEMMQIRILDSYGNKIYNARVEISNKKALANAFFILKKYGIDLEEINNLMKKSNY